MIFNDAESFMSLSNWLIYMHSMPVVLNSSRETALKLNLNQGLFAAPKTGISVKEDIPRFFL